MATVDAQEALIFVNDAMAALDEVASDEPAIDGVVGSLRRLESYLLDNIESG